MRRRQEGGKRALWEEPNEARRIKEVGSVGAQPLAGAGPRAVHFMERDGVGADDEVRRRCAPGQAVEGEPRGARSDGVVDAQCHVRD